MKLRIAQSLVIVGLVLLLSLLVTAQDRQVVIERFEIDGKAVETDFKVRIATKAGEFEAATSPTGFVVPAQIFDEGAEEWVDLVITFKGFELSFSRLHRSNFNAVWHAVGVDTEPYESRWLGDENPENVLRIYYLQIGGRISLVRITK